MEPPIDNQPTLEDVVNECVELRAEVEKWKGRVDAANSFLAGYDTRYKKVGDDNRELRAEVARLLSKIEYKEDTIRKQFKNIELYRSAAERRDREIKRLKDAISIVLRYTSSHQFYDKDGEGVLRRALEDVETEEIHRTTKWRWSPEHRLAKRGNNEQ